MNACNHYYHSPWSQFCKIMILLTKSVARLKRLKNTTLYISLDLSRDKMIQVLVPSVNARPDSTATLSSVVTTIPANNNPVVQMLIVRLKMDELCVGVGKESILWIIFQSLTFWLKLGYKGYKFSFFWK